MFSLKYLAGRTNAPIFKYLRACGLLNPDGFANTDALPLPLQTRVKQGVGFFKASEWTRRRASELAQGIESFQTFLDDATMYEISMALSVMDTGSIELPALYAKLKNELESTPESTMPTELAKAICICDLALNRKI